MSSDPSLTHRSLYSLVRQGIAALLKLADSFAKRAIRNAEDDVIQLGAVKCLRILSSVALRSFLTTTGACSVMAAQLLSTHQEVVRTAMAVLDSIASLHVGHSFISEALPVPPAADGSGPDPAGKFALLLRILSEDTAASKEGGPAKELSLSQLALKHQALNVINAIIEGREELDARFTLRNQLVRAGMLEVVGSLRELSANHEVRRIRHYLCIRITFVRCLLCHACGLQQEYSTCDLIIASFRVCKMRSIGSRRA